MALLAVPRLIIPALTALTAADSLPPLHITISSVCWAALRFQLTNQVCNQVLTLSIYVDLGQKEKKSKIQQTFRPNSLFPQTWW